MFNHFICGSGNFHHQEGEDYDMDTCSTPKRSSKRSKNSRYNPYADRGLDKFSQLLANLEDKKQKIYTQMGSDDISFVRFVYSNSNSIKPIIIKLKDKNQTSSSDTDDDKQMIKKKNLEFVNKKIIHEVLANIPEERRKMVESNKRRKYFRNLKLANFKKPSYYMPLAIILILVFLAIYGRCFAILCTSIGWYLIPTIKASSRRTKRRHVKKLSKENLTSSKGTIYPNDHKLLDGRHVHI